MAKVLYHQEAREPKEFTVLKKHENGTLDIGPEGGPAVVTEVKVLDEPKPGYVTLIKEADDKPKAADKPKEADKPKAK
jgi:hypothetical protein